MSSDSLAVFRKSMGPELAKLADQHMQHDLRQSDRDALQKAAGTVSTHTGVGSLLGIALGIFLAYRIRSNRAAMFNAFKTADQPVAVKFAGGKEEAIPDLTPLLRPSTLGDVATYSLLGAGGLFFGGETGLLTGTFRARQQIGADRESRERIETAFRKFRADALRAQANLLDQSGRGDAWSLT
ncbi:hypothetical protein BAUCODRAFT_158285 [Baudoinia panamericana UAMH 10762]|uniref:Uncharacterized protein n=1 Tax=Baudoinia panamericana (strain UAMH 10762) TaxID=717646 RepID=M2N7G9_BAUPA|nr:uncharacterized protein BAUCODRAFT_158285 [Baudoinia panamericana UAMH 10762]EMC94755.1 hypothetical protein BAUCODRAFT_158285 [Baudoinia panamericana UAMH 10762]